MTDVERMVNNLEEAESYVPDTSVIIEGILSHLIKNSKFKGKVIIHNAVLAELEHQANNGQQTGFMGLDEIKELKKYVDEGKIELEFDGARPTPNQIKFAKQGEIDSIIRDLAFEKEATLITADKVQAKVAEVVGIKNQLLEFSTEIKGIKVEKFFDESTMSIHLKEDTLPRAKKGKPGEWDFVTIGKDKTTIQEMEDYMEDLIEKTKIDKNSFIEIQRKSSIILQFRNYRTVITMPPLSDGLEITSVRPVKRLTLAEYHLKPELAERLEKKAEGILVAGAPGNGKTTFCQALAEFYLGFNKNVKTVEAPRDLILPNEVTQYSKNRATNPEIHDILLLSRPDYTIFDEIRNTADFELFKDLRLSGVGMVGVVHATNPIDSIQRFIGKVELGMVPSIIDTVIFIDKGQVSKVLSLKMTVKVPSGMTEEDLTRPVVEVTDFETKEPIYEIYVFGEETVVVPVTKKQSKKETSVDSIAKKVLEERIRDELKEKTNFTLKITGQNNAELYLPKNMIPKIIGKGGKRIEKLEERVGIKLNIKDAEELSTEEKKEKQEKIGYELNYSKNSIIFTFPMNLESKSVDFYNGEDYIFTATISKKGEIRIGVKSELGARIRDLINSNEKIDVLL